jgi:signal transduction histidine kinase
MSAAPVPAGGARSGGVVAVIQDITRSKELDEVKSEFLSMITHDLRGPLATIKGLTDALASTLEDNEDVLSDLEAIDEEVDQTTDLVSNLLDMSRIEAGSYPLELEVSYLIDLVGDAQNRALRSRLGNGRGIEFSQDADMPPAYVDPRQMGRILDNLISNALKYSDSDVRIRSEYNDKDRVIKTFVSDTGIGIPAEIRSLVFDKFFRVTAGASVARGVGLGLTICKAIVEAHGGRIGVQPTDDGVGSTFWFTIPSYHEDVIQPQKVEA